MDEFIGPVDSTDAGVIDRCNRLSQLIASRMVSHKPWIAKKAINQLSLFSFTHLNEWLSSSLILPPRKRVFKQGNIRPFEYVRRYRTNRQCLDGKALSALLSRGSTLVLNHYDDIHPAVRELAMEFKSHTGLSAGANLHAS